MTGSAPPDLQGCHLTNTIRGSSPDKVQEKKDIVSIPFCVLICYSCLETLDRASYHRLWMLIPT